LRHFDTSKNDPKSGERSEIKFSAYRSFLFLRRGTFSEQKHAQNRGQEKQKKNNPIWMIGHGNDATYKNDFQIFEIARNGPRNGDHIHKKSYAIFKI